MDGSIDSGPVAADLLFFSICHSVVLSRNHLLVPIRFSPTQAFSVSPLWSLSHFPPALSSVSICSWISPSSPVPSLLSAPITLSSNRVTAPVSRLRVTTRSSAELLLPSAAKVGTRRVDPGPSLESGQTKCCEDHQFPLQHFLKADLTSRGRFAQPLQQSAAVRGNVTFKGSEVESAGQSRVATPTFFKGKTLNISHLHVWMMTDGATAS